MIVAMGKRKVPYSQKRNFVSMVVPTENVILFPFLFLHMKFHLRFCSTIFHFCISSLDLFFPWKIQKKKSDMFSSVVHYVCPIDTSPSVCDAIVSRKKLDDDVKDIAKCLSKRG